MTSPTIECRNSKQYQRLKGSKPKTTTNDGLFWVLVIQILNLFRISALGFRIWRGI